MSICLSMIVKNEAHCIEKCLESVKPFIDYWIICCDTTTSDNTEEVIKKCLKDIPGEIHNHDWVDFSTNRNLALHLSKDKADYSFFIDADDYVSFTDLNILKNINGKAYYIKYEYKFFNTQFNYQENIEYDRISLVHNSIDYKFIGIGHEEIYINENVNVEKLNGLKINYGANGSRSKDPLKYVKSAQEFEKALLIDPDNSRYVFYCAQSYKDANIPEQAIKFYTKRISMGGYFEEIYISLLEIAKLIKISKNDNYNEVESAFIRAYNYLPSRAESLYYLIVYCREKGFFDKGYFYSKICSNIIKPKNHMLFIDDKCYNWQLQDELAIASYYVGDYKLSYEINLNLLKIDLPDNHKKRIYSNLQFCKTKY